LSPDLHYSLGLIRPLVQMYTLYTRRLCCRSERPGQAGELGAEEPDEVQQGQVQGPVPGEEQPHAPVKTWGGPAGEQFCGDERGSAGG